MASLQGPLGTISAKQSCPPPNKSSPLLPVVGTLYLFRTQDTGYRKCQAEAGAGYLLC